MRFWPFSGKMEKREAQGGYHTLVARLIEAQAVGSTQNASATAAVEAVAGLLSRAFASAQVRAADDLQAALSPRVLAQTGRDLIRVGESLHVVRYSGGNLRLLPASTWYWEGGADPDDWLATATLYGPSGSATYRLPWSAIIWSGWGSSAARPYHGISPQGWAAETARLVANSERALADEASGPVAQLLTVPEGKDDDDEDPLAPLRKDISDARGAALLVDTTASGWGDGKGNAPQRDYDPRPLHPNPAESLVKVSDMAFQRTVAAAGASVALFDDSDGTSKREALRQFHLGTVRPLARILEAECTAKFGEPVRLEFDLYNVDLAGRAQAFKGLVGAGVPVDEALQKTGLIEND